MSYKGVRELVGVRAEWLRGVGTSRDMSVVGVSEGIVGTLLERVTKRKMRG